MSTNIEQKPQQQPRKFGKIIDTNIDNYSTTTNQPNQFKIIEKNDNKMIKVIDQVIDKENNKIHGKLEKPNTSRKSDFDRRKLKPIDPQSIRQSNADQTLVSPKCDKDHDDNDDDTDDDEDTARKMIKWMTTKPSEDDDDDNYLCAMIQLRTTYETLMAKLMEMNRLKQKIAEIRGQNRQLEMIKDEIDDIYSKILD